MSPHPEETISTLLAGAADLLDIRQEVYQLAVSRYEDVGNWLVQNGGDGWTVYPQGSFRIGTVIKPPTSTVEYDIDLVCHKRISKGETTKEALKVEVGELLRSYDEYKFIEGKGDGPELCVEGRRCWTLTYPALGFHLDVLPAIPDEEEPPTGIMLTDTKNIRWQYSNPKGYSTWFQDRSEELRRILEAKRRTAGVAAVPVWSARSTLQRMVQVFKWHCYLHFADDIGDRPPSVLITTLAARAYQGDVDLFAAALNAVDGMSNHIKFLNDKWWVPNPAHRKENFADKWNEYPARRDKFYSWLHDLRSTLVDVARSSRRDTESVIAGLSNGFGEGLLIKSAQRMGLEGSTLATAAIGGSVFAQSAPTRPHKPSTEKFGPVPIVRTRSGRAG